MVGDPRFWTVDFTGRLRRWQVSCLFKDKNNMFHLGTNRHVQVRIIIMNRHSVKG